MPIPKPKPNEQRDEFLGRCMSDPKMITEYKDAKQRYAICITTYQEQK